MTGGGAPGMAGLRPRTPGTGETPALPVEPADFSQTLPWAPHGLCGGVGTDEQRGGGEWRYMLLLSTTGVVCSAAVTGGKCSATTSPTGGGAPLSRRLPTPRTWPANVRQR